MPAPRVAQHWRNAIFAIVAENSKLTKEAIADELAKRARTGDVAAPLGQPLGTPPSVSTIGRIVRIEWPKLKEEQRKAYRVARWPQSFMAGALAWEAGPSTLELLRHYDQGPRPRRPSVGVARWYYWLSLLAPDVTASDRAQVAEELAFREANGYLDGGTAKDGNYPVGPPEDLDYFLAFAPWREENKRSGVMGVYNESRERRGLTSLPTNDMETLSNFLWAACARGT